MKVLLISLGCDKNLVDSEYMIGMLTGGGQETAPLEMTDDVSEADIIIVNSCCFIGDAKEESINTILEMAEYRTNGQCRSLIVTGCLAERYRDEIRKEIPEVDAIIGTNSFDDIREAIRRTLEDGAFFSSFKPLSGLPKLREPRVLSTGGHYAYLKIAEGCDKNCTYCVIPSVRGRYRSVPMEELLQQARRLAEGGVKELILVAQETTLYGVDLYGEKSLHRLLVELGKIPGIFWIRLLYCYPEEIYEELIETIRTNPKVCHYLDMPIQHCNDDLLRRMGRRTDKAGIVRMVERLRERVPDITLRTTLICGFPGETEQMHEELMQFVNDMEFDRLGAFCYSQEEGTPAAGFADQVPEEIKKRWQEEVMELEEEIIMDRNETMIGCKLDVFVEGRVADEDVYIGRTYRDAPDVDGYLFIQSPDEDRPLGEDVLVTGDLCRVRVSGTYEYDMIGELL